MKVNVKQTFFLTDYILNSASSVHIKFALKSDKGLYNSGILGVRNRLDDNKCFYLNILDPTSYDGQKFQYAYCGNEGTSLGSVTNTKIYEAVLCSSGASWNGQSASWEGRTLQEYSNAYMPIGSYYDTGDYANNICNDLDIYFVKIYENGALVRNYIPALYNGYGALKDTINNTYLAAQTPSAATFDNHNYKWIYLKADTAHNVPIYNLACDTNLTLEKNIYFSTLPNITYTGQSQNTEEYGWPWDNRVYVGSNGTAIFCGHGASNYNSYVNYTDEIGDGKTWTGAPFNTARYICGWENSAVISAMSNNQIAAYVPITFEPSQSSLSFTSSGGSKTFTVTSEGEWSSSTASDWVSVSPTTGASGETSITVTAPNYTGTTKRSATISYENADGETFDISVKQKAPSTGGTSTLYVGEENITSIYLGDTAISTIYLGDTEVFNM